MELQPDLPELPSVHEIAERLSLIFPEGTPNRNYCTRDLAAKTIFVMLYTGAVEHLGVYARPDQVTRMTDVQSRKGSASDRRAWAIESIKPQAGAIQGRWYAANTREPIRDETLRQGLITANAVVERKELPTTSSKPRYALRESFAALFHPKLKKKPLQEAVQTWRKENLSLNALARTELLRKTGGLSSSGVRVEFPNGETRLMEPGPSSIISKAVIEEFAKRFLGQPVVVWLSESGNKVVARDDEIAKAIGLTIPVDRSLPDIILAELKGNTTLLVFVEVVATDGAVNDLRKKSLMDMAAKAGFDADNLAFVTAFLDRDHPSFRRCVSTLAWRSFVWFASEPDKLVALYDGGNCATRLREFLQSIT